MSYLSEPGWHQRTAFVFAQLMQCVYNANPRQGVFDAVRRLCGEGPQTFYFPRVGLGPACVIGYLRQELFVLVEGCKDRFQFAACAEGYRASLLSVAEETRHDFFHAEAQRIAGYVKGLDKTDYDSVTIAGHSMGGAIAHVLTLQDAFDGIGFSSRQAISFGAPIPCQRVDNEMLNHKAAQYRWFRPLDQIPFIPPSCGSCLGLRLVAGSKSCSKFARFQPMAEGCQIADAGFIANHYYPTGPRIDSCTDLAAFLLASWERPFNQHGIAGYVEALTMPLEALGEGGFGGGDEPEPSPLRAVVETRPLAMAGEREANRLLVNLEAQQNSLPVVIPSQQTVYAVKTGKVWSVMFGGVVIAVRPGKRAARNLARDLQTFLYRLQKAAVVSPGALVETLTEYLAAASDPAGGFTPVMNVRIPN